MTKSLYEADAEWLMNASKPSLYCLSVSGRRGEVSGEGAFFFRARLRSLSVGIVAVSVSAFQVSSFYWSRYSKMSPIEE